MPKNPVWGEDETKLYEAIVKTQDLNVLNPLFANLKEPNSFHLWKDADFSLLFHASVGNNKVAVEKLLEAGADPSLQNLNGTTVFVLFVKRSQIEMMDMCLAKIPKEKRAAVLNSSSNSGWTALMTAAENGQTASAKWLIENGADVNASMPSTGWTAGHAATKKGNLEVLELLLKNGADQSKQAMHRDFGKNLGFEDVTQEKPVLELLSKYA